MSAKGFSAVLAGCSPSTLRVAPRFPRDQEHWERRDTSAAVRVGGRPKGGTTTKDERPCRVVRCGSSSETEIGSRRGHTALPATPVRDSTAPPDREPRPHNPLPVSGGSAKETYEDASQLVEHPVLWGIDPLKVLRWSAASHGFASVASVLPLL